MGKNTKYFKTKGFTLIELLVVISILSILTGLGTSTWITTQQKGRDTRRKEDLSQIKAGLQLYFEQNKSYPPPTSVPATQAVYSSDSGTNWIPNLVESGLMQKIPKDPKQAGIITTLANLIPKINFGQIQQDVKSKIASLLPKFGGIEQKPKGQVAGTTTVTFTQAAANDNGMIYTDYSASYPPTGIYVQQGSPYLPIYKNCCNYVIYNGFIRWNTSTIPAGATITSANVIFTPNQAPGNVNSRNLVGEWYNWSTLSSSDYTSSVGNTAFTKAVSTFATAGVQYTIPLSNPSSYISRTGYTGLRLGIDGAAPSGTNFTVLYTLNTAGAPYVPQLQVTYTVNPDINVTNLVLKTNNCSGTTITSATPIANGTTIAYCVDYTLTDGPASWTNRQYLNQATQPPSTTPGSGSDGTMTNVASGTYTNQIMATIAADNTKCTTTCTASIFFDYNNSLTESNETNNFRAASYQVVPPCTPTSPGAPTLTSPANSSTNQSPSGANLIWTAPSSWGTECATAARKYKTYLGTTNPPSYDASKDQVETSTTTSFYPNLDGFIDSYTSTYANAREGTGTLISRVNNGNIQMGQALFSPNYYAEEGFLSFDTSSLGASATITAATLTMRGQCYQGGTFTLEARQHDWGATLENADFVPGSSLSSKTLLASYTIPTWNVSGGNNTFTSNGLNFVNAINKTGSTRFIVTSSLQSSGTAPTGDNQRACSYEMENGASQAPKLDITYTAAPPLTVSTGALALGQTYYWKIGAVNRNNNETSSSVFSFSTIAPAPIICTQSSPPYGQTINTGTLVTLQASGGDGTNYNFSTTGSTNNSQNGPSSTWSGSWATPGSKTVNVTSAGLSASCTVNVSAPAMGSNSCANLVGVYCYIAAADRKSFVIWAQLENTKDNDTRLCLDSPAPDGTGKWNYCVRSE